MNYSEEQNRRLRALGADEVECGRIFADAAERNRCFQRVETGLVAEQHRRLAELYAGEPRPAVLRLEEELAALLRTEGFLQVHTPIIMTRTRLEKMGITDGSLMEKQVFWIDAKHCLRPMLAPHLYEYMRETGRLLPRPIRLFEVGPCFRRETQGARHGNEFTMLNLVEMGLPEDQDRTARLRELGGKVLDTAGITGWSMADEDSTVYGETADFVDQNGLELASSAIGPLDMDAPWGITENWIGIGFGLERLTMSAQGESNLAKAGRSLSYLNGIRLRI